MTDEKESFALETMINFAKDDECLDLARLLKSIYNS